MGPHRLPEACSKASCQRWPGCERGFPERKRCPKVTVNPQRISRLQEHGLTEYEARAYLALCELIGKAREDFAVATSAMGAHRLAYNHDLLEQAADRGARVRVLAPGTSENEEAAARIAERCDLRHALVDLGAVTLAFVDEKE